MCALGEEASLIQGVWELGKISFLPDLTATSAHTSLLIVWCSSSQPLSKGREGAGISHVWAPLPTTHHLASPAASSSLQEACCPLTLDRVHSTALGLACCWASGSITPFPNVQRKRGSSPREWAGYTGIHYQFQGPTEVHHWLHTGFS